MNYDLISLRKLKDRFGSEYAATMYVAKEARKLLTRSHNLLSESEAIDWVILQRTDDDLQKYIQEYRHRLRKRKYNLVNEYMSMIDENKLKIQFQKSALQSNKERRLIIDYDNLDEADCTRLRILLKEYWLDHLRNEISDIVMA